MKMLYYRIYVGHETEEGRKVRRAESLIENIVSNHIEGATIISTTGLWAGQKEPASVIDIFLTPSKANKRRVQAISRELDIKLQQEAVMVVTMPDVQVKFTDYD